MYASRRIGVMVSAAILAGACSNLVPDLPPDFALPMQEILLQAACELQYALRVLDVPEYQRFKARKWLIAVTLQPKVDTDLALSLGATRRVPTELNAIRVTTWVIGQLPGAQVDYRAERTGAVTFNFKSNELIADTKLPCDQQTPTLHVLAQHLGVGQWLYRTVEAVNATPSGLIDKPSYTTDITIKFSGTGSYTYTFPHGTDFATLAGSYSLDEQLNILMTELTDNKIVAVTLPSGDKNGFVIPSKPPEATTASVQAARERLDVIQLDQTLRSLRIQTQ
jgi:hypothetical protein